jgi:hypothetical protein
LPSTFIVGTFLDPDNNDPGTEISEVERDLSTETFGAIFEVIRGMKLLKGHCLEHLWNAMPDILQEEDFNNDGENSLFQKLV